MPGCLSAPSACWWICRRTKRAEEFTKQILESSQDCIKVLDLDGHLLSINACGIRALEVKDVGSALGARYLDFWQDADRKAAEAALQQALKGGVGRFIACFRTPSGVVTWWDEIITPILGAQGKPDKLLVISRDITETRAAAEQREVLIKELDHRVKNTLATVQSIANATLPASPALQAYLGRLQALAQAHRLLAETRWDGGCLETIITTIVSPYPEQVQVRGGGVRLSARAAQTMCMVMHDGHRDGRHDAL
jgi:PAS domain S-box-containing protein